MDYLLKVSLAWASFLLLFETLYKHNGRFRANRLYLLFAVACGLLLPLIHLPRILPGLTANAPDLFPAMPGIASASRPVAGPLLPANRFDVLLTLRVLYSLGVALLAVKFLFESGSILRLALRGKSQIIGGYKIVVTGGRHAPYSFMGRIFIRDLNAYRPGELVYIIRHEAAHNRHWHWLDLCLLQLLSIFCWFHPLIWRFRYLLQLQHEYEADAEAAQDDAYTYGHFLLQQTLLLGSPSIAPSFHFSPIKNRINMLTRNQQTRRGAWKYLLLLPALLGCTLLMAKDPEVASRLRKGNVTTYNGLQLKWRELDIAGMSGAQTIYELNGEPVYQNEQLHAPATYDAAAVGYSDYLRKEFKAYRRSSGDTITAVNVLHLVINTEGKVVYYDLSCSRPPSPFGGKEWYPYGDQEPVLNAVMDKIIRESPAWTPARINGRPVISIINFRGGC